MSLLILAVLAVLVGAFAPRLLRNIHQEYRASVEEANKTRRRRGEVEKDLPPAEPSSLLTRAISITAFVLAGFLVFMTSFTYIDTDKVGHLKRIYGTDMPTGRVIATGWQKGPRAEILPPGFQFSFFLKVLNDIEELNTVEVAAGKLRVLTAKDGRALPDGQYMADGWPEKEFEQYLDAQYFMGIDTENGLPRGYKGLQLTVLKPGTYRVNRYLFDVGDPVDETEIDAGFVGVVKSNVGQKYIGDPIVPKSIVASYIEASRLEIGQRRIRLNQMLEEINKREEEEAGKSKLVLSKTAIAPTEQPAKAELDDKAPVAIPTFLSLEGPVSKDKIKAELDGLKAVSEEEARIMALTNLSNPLVPQGDIGVWESVLLPGKYYLNPFAYTVTKIDTRVQTWRYEGGYIRRTFNLTVDKDGSIVQTVSEEKVDIPEGAADGAINHKVEGWDVWLDSRILVQVTPENAPFVVAYVGDLKQVEDRIITPLYRSVSRNILGNRDVKVLQVIYERQKMEALVEGGVKPEALKTGLIARDVRFGDPYVPPELLIPGKRMQLAQQMNETFQQEKIAQTARIQAEKEKAEADQQETLIAAQIKKQADEQLGLGAKARLEAEAQGQRAQVAVLGQDKTLELALFRELLTVLKDHPEMVKQPEVLVEGGGSDFSSAAAILGHSNLSKAVAGAFGKN
ncbi:MAG: hypothetical protein UT86_C0003G0091 [Candidatus Magasanikbacteria bacterium GW2011_GWC2_40_17]|uniref:Band 7 domain-containing protein n=1 Tax=Candidatus Magasanikbacteria bacterium GW2011_GWA2_42_32 TaxID=1619039 RepID=A0A0G1A7S2_9BACT|nr:MAG: hypothetical protein UT86_C0003G0091 [Candidatus Magasanikbacteria bacterium GW2011_GWC2_40_17]KKS56994.1 MAG: hypothetical protein UV20_C0004G0090 [Candidatus Magasanikbacteria bacterium GW2011_GWA2_42_32]OGH85721.1 MAG: hypothetical protein A2294_03790 [Candidatus Magasanikbacteria bacterium RIFOXYB2_FULL_38_10]